MNPGIGSRKGTTSWMVHRGHSLLFLWSGLIPCLLFLPSSRKRASHHPSRSPASDAFRRLQAVDSPLCAEDSSKASGAHGVLLFTSRLGTDTSGKKPRREHMGCGLRRFQSLFPSTLGEHWVDFHWGPFGEDHLHGLFLNVHQPLLRGFPI